MSIEVENSLREMGLTGLTDYTSPEMVTLPTGGARWMRWASQPLDVERQALLANAEPEHHAALIEEATREVTPWHELTDIERKGFLASWRKNGVGNEIWMNYPGTQVQRPCLGKSVE